MVEIIQSLADDLLPGAAAIAEFLFGDRRKKRKVYHLQHQLPLFHMGATLCGRKSTLLSHMAEQERGAGAAPAEEARAQSPPPQARRRRQRAA
jgi:hypothetical protein